ncbi:hypothetical protein J3R83DRAFT_13045 [Lanmaoa asiatica]|nr:hypothetical protein J3R83DRAFT_13045 [Lanmaoa asiatica]
MRVAKEASLPLSGKQFKVEDVQEVYVEQKENLLGALDGTKTILAGLREFNKNDWVVRYPTLQEQPNDAPVTPSKQKLSTLPSVNGPTRAVTLASIADVQEHPSELADENAADSTDKETFSDKTGDFTILRLDLKLGPHGSSASPAALVSQLEKGSIANLLDERISAALQHMDKLRLRVEDTSSKVLVTGDLNSGKSTFVNALLRREVMTVDQQPCTTAFCEVHDAAENNGVEEVHVLKDGVQYSIADESTFSRVSLADLESIVTDNEGNQPRLKVYLADSRATSESLLNNGVVDISLIDAPGLNRDSLKTTAVFTRQEEIDVIVFVVSAENHFTLSAKEFLWNASNEKAYIFIVVNKFDQIKNKEKCKRLVLDQIKEFSPRTHENAQDLVHFVDSAAALRPYTANPAFDDLESSLRSFVLVKRSQSKFHPVSTYLSKLLTDIDLLVGANAIVAQMDIDRAKGDLERAKPVFEKMKSERENLEDALEIVEENGASTTANRTRAILSGALERVGRGQPGVDVAISLPRFPGFLGIWDYARDVRKALLASLDAAVKLAEDEARLTTTANVKKIGLLGDQFLPEGVERSRRVFMPEAMFSVRPGNQGSARRRTSPTASAVVAGGVYNLGIGLSQRSDMLDTSILDLFDFNHHLWMHFGDGKTDGEDIEEKNATALSILSVGVGALTMTSQQEDGWLPVIGAMVVGATAYFILELPSTIPKSIGRRIRASLVKVEDGATEQVVFVNAHAGRVSRETRKVLRFASWDLRERFRTAMEDRGNEVQNAEELERKARKALDYFHGVERETGVVRDDAGLTTAL